MHEILGVICDRYPLKYIINNTSHWMSILRNNVLLKSLLGKNQRDINLVKKKSTSSKNEIASLKTLPGKTQWIKTWLRKKDYSVDLFLLLSTSLVMFQPLHSNLVSFKS